MITPNTLQKIDNVSQKYQAGFLTALILALSVWEFYQGHIGNGVMYVLLSGVFIFLYFKNELILLAFLRLRKQVSLVQKYG